MALEIRSIPVLEGISAERFIREAEENERMPKLHLSGISDQQISSMLERGKILRMKQRHGEL